MQNFKTPQFYCYETHYHTGCNLFSAISLYAQNPNIIWQRTIGGAGEDFLYDLKETTDGSYILEGSSKSNISGDKTEDARGQFDFWIIKHTETLGLEENSLAATVTLFPNPANNTLQIDSNDKTISQIYIYSLSGSKISQIDLDTVSPQIDVSSLASGIYFIQLYSEKNVVLKKFVKE